MQRLHAIISSGETSGWISCRSITPLVVEAYAGLFGDQQTHYGFRASMRSQEILALARRIFAARPMKIIFVDHLPHPLELTAALSFAYGARPLPPLYFHIYGDFTHFSPEWLKLIAELERRKARATFICASARQARMLKGFLHGAESSVHVCHFSVDTENFRYSVRARRDARRRWELDKEFAVVYTGRLTLQKNIHCLIESFARAAGPQTRFLLAGHFDDVSAPFFERKSLPGEYFQTVQRTLESLTPSQRERVQFVGSLSGTHLRDLYLASDCYVSLSTHHDEDFGISPAEALCCGSPAILSDWGGFPTFRGISSEDVDLIPVKIARHGLILPTGQFETALKRRMAAPENDATRSRRSRDYCKALSPAAAAETLATIHAQSPHIIRGATPKLETHAKHLPEGPVFAATSHAFYRGIYASYVGETHGR